MHLGNLLYTTLFVRLYNQLADIVAQERPDASDEELFSVARWDELLLHACAHVVLCSLQWTANKGLFSDKVYLP